MKYREKKDGEVEHSKEQNAASDLALAWPTMLEQFLQTAVQYIDTAMVGSLGTQATAAVGSTSTVNWLIGSTVSAIGVGLLAFISQSFGAGNPGTRKKGVRTGCFSSACGRNQFYYRDCSNQQAGAGLDAGR